LLQKAGFQKVEFERISFPTIRMDSDRSEKKWKILINTYLPKWQIETRFVARSWQGTQPHGMKERAKLRPNQTDRFGYMSF
jgi:hypothetical protein